MQFEIADASNRDVPDIIRVIRAVYDEYGFTWESGGYHADIEDVERWYWRVRGAFWVLRDGSEVVGTCGVHSLSDHACELARLYLRKDLRGLGLGKRLFRLSLDWSRAAGYRLMEIWSDVKLEDAHRLYLRNGARWIGQRVCPDPDQSIENGFLYVL